MNEIKWFGAGCKYLSCLWENPEDPTRTTSQQQNYEPVLIFCNHVGNTSKHEGNCVEDLCPLKENTK